MKVLDLINILEQFEDTLDVVVPTPWLEAQDSPTVTKVTSVVLKHDTHGGPSYVEIS